MKDNWISVKDRLPENEIEVNVCAAYFNIQEFYYAVGYYREDEKRWMTNGYLLDTEYYIGRLDGEIITHWKPIEPPAEEVK